MRILLGLICLCWNLMAWAQQAGKVDFVDGSVKIVDAANKERLPKVGEMINEGETVHTGKDGELHLAMLDGGELGIHPNTRMRIEKYKAEGGKDDISTFSLLQGAMRSVTGWIGKYNTRNYSIRTPTATIGVRGTDHETRVIPEGSSEGEPGTYDKVNAGATQIRTKYGTTDVRPNQAGFFGFNARSKPTLLARVPELFRPMRSEKRFEGLHEKIRERVGGLRQERAKFVATERFERKKAFESERRQRLEQHRGSNSIGDKAHGPQSQQLRQERRQRFEQGRGGGAFGGDEQKFERHGKFADQPRGGQRENLRNEFGSRQKEGRGRQSFRDGQQETRGGGHGHRGR